ncbi:hypothetical protein EJ03DRAFT_182623 [Teratosphaeria nubilosa]|uniref:Uncharacterized protein n=1 Tax=Teratosphaeria nubilosa TaxID=161662 RepID=A0A6G1L038_9PEZI|nr:hypothetical protein EJ03DRAFT_182623 [Teratosphaeria nubilosa]
MPKPNLITIMRQNNKIFVGSPVPRTALFALYTTRSTFDRFLTLQRTASNSAFLSHAHDRQKSFHMYNSKFVQKKSPSGSPSRGTSVQMSRPFRHQKACRKAKGVSNFLESKSNTRRLHVLLDPVEELLVACSRLGRVGFDRKDIVTHLAVSPRRDDDI